MNFLYVPLIVLSVFISTSTYAQQTAPKDTTTTQAKKTGSEKKPLKSSKLSVNAGFGLASYFGDLRENNKLLSQPGFSFGAGATWEFIPHFNGRLDVGILQIKAADSKNTDPGLKARNLSFKTTVIDVAVSGEYYMLNMNKFRFSPYLFVGIGVGFYTPTAVDALGKKYKLRELGTEGQGLPGYPHRKIYNKATTVFPMGFGFKYAATKKVMIQFEFNYRGTTTDYLDDVSSGGYPSKAMLDARNPTTAKFTYRGNEVGGEPYPTSPGLNRGNPENKDSYYTTQLKLAFKL